MLPFAKNCFFASMMPTKTSGKTWLAEVVRKECEQYRLIEFGLLHSVEEGVALLQSQFPSSAVEEETSFPSFYARRKKALNRFYSRVRFADFLMSQGRSAAFGRFLFFFQQRLLIQIRETHPFPTIDKELAIPTRTVAFKLSKEMAESYRERLLQKIEKVKFPAEMKKCCRCFLVARFPLKWPGLLEQLKKPDEAYWLEIYKLVKKLAERVTTRLYPATPYKKEIEQDTWADASLFLQEKLTTGPLPALESALHFRRYILSVCKYKCYEAERRNQMRQVVWEPDGVEEELIAELTEEEPDEAGETRWDDIDPLDNVAVSRALTAVLWDRIEPWYGQLTEGQEEKVRILFLRYVSGQSYAEIVRQRHGILSPQKARKEEAKLRQEVVRIRKRLKQRFIRLLNMQKNK